METEGDKNVEGLRDALADAFEQARAVVADWLEKNGVPPVMPRLQMVVEENEAGTGWSGREVEVNPRVTPEGCLQVVAVVGDRGPGEGVWTPVDM